METRRAGAVPAVRGLTIYMSDTDEQQLIKIVRARLSEAVDDFVMVAFPVGDKTQPYVFTAQKMTLEEAEVLLTNGLKTVRDARRDGPRS